MPGMAIHWRVCVMATFGAAAVGVALAPNHARAGSALCPMPERVLFSCAVGAKEVAVCASGKLTETTGIVQYRFGRPSRVELAYPPEGGDWRSVTRGATLAFSGGGGAFLVFDRPPYRYVVYTAVGQGWGSKSGVLIERSGNRIANLTCTNAANSELGPALYSLAGILPFEESFELP